MRNVRPLAFLMMVIALFFAGDRMLALALDQVVAHSDFRFSKLYRGGLDYDVLVVGNSRAVHSIFAPDLSRRLCRRVFNIAYNGMSAEIAAAVVRDYLAHNAPPKVVIIEVSDAADENDLLPDMRLYARRHSHLAALLDRDQPRIAELSRIFHLYAFDDEMMLRAAYYLGRTDQDWIMPDEAMTPTTIAHLQARWFPEPRLMPGNVAALKSLAHDLARHGIKTVLFIAPYHPVFRRFVPDYETWVAELRRALGPSLPILDLSQSLKLNADFADPTHTNIRGSHAVMEMLAGRLDAALPRETALECPPRAPAQVAYDSAVGPRE